MKHPMYVLFALVLLIATGTTLSYIVVVRRNLTNSPSIRLETKLSSPYLNATLLRYAETDLAKDRFEQEVNEFLQANFSKPWRRNSSWIKFPNVNIKFMLHPMFNQIWLESRKVLTSWFTNKRFQPEIMSELISLVKHPIDNYSGHVEELHRRYSTCAVVGNSGILLEKEYGDLIDSHEVVIRLKNARIEGFQNNVGSKTSISFMNSNRIHRCARKTGCFCHPYGEEVPIVMYTSRPVHFLDYLLCKSSHKAPLLVTDARFDLLCARIVKYYSLKRFVEETGKPVEKWGPAHKGVYFHYSSGMQAVMLALGICDSVSIFGFGKSATAKHHYHTNQTTELYIHDYEAEYAFYDDLVNRPQVIPFLTDSFKIPPVLVYR